MKFLEDENVEGQMSQDITIIFSSAALRQKGHHW